MADHLAADDRFADPGDGSIHQEANITILKYAGNGQWKYEEDVYNPSRLGIPLVEITEARSIAWLQAFISGSLIHIVAFGVSHDHDRHVEPVAQFQDWGYRLGILIGLFLVFTAPELHG